MDLEAIRLALATKIKGQVGTQVAGFDGYVPPQFTAPCVLIEPRVGEYVTYEGTFDRPHCVIRFDVVMLVPPAMGTEGQRLLDSFLSTGKGQRNSIYDALTRIPHLGDGSELGEEVQVDGPADYRGEVMYGLPDAQIPYLAAALPVAVHKIG